jgi:hypothetical protein
MKTISFHRIIIFVLLIVLWISKNIFLNHTQSNQILCASCAVLFIIVFMLQAKKIIYFSNLTLGFVYSFILSVCLCCAFANTSSIWMQSEALPFWIGFAFIIPVQEYLQKTKKYTPSVSTRKAFEFLFIYSFVAELIEWGIKSKLQIASTTYESQIDISKALIGAACVILVGRAIAFVAFFVSIVKKPTV